MQKLTDVGTNFVNDLASRYGLSHEAVIHMLVAVNNGGCSMAQFSCSELGGSGQWMRGGMTMVGDMFNIGLKNTVDNLCNELANILSNNQIFPVVDAGTAGSNQWWPSNLGTPFSCGSQNNTRYAIFPKRLAVEVNGQISVYDTLDHNIGGVSQQQGGNDSLTFNSQWGSISVNTLPLISGQAQITTAQTNFGEHTQQRQPAQEFSQVATQIVESTIEPNIQSNNQSNIETIHSQYNEANKMIEILTKLAELRDLGVLTETEFNNKKAELLK